MSEKRTIYDIAEEVGVSPATVSRALSGSGHISPETRERVMAAAKDFTPRRRGDSTPDRTPSHTIGLVVAHNSSYFFTNRVYCDIMNGISEASTPQGYTLLLDTRNASPEDVIRTYSLGKVDGFILLGIKNSNQLISRLQDADIPFVLVGDYVDEFGIPPYSKIDIDDFSAARSATEYLLNLGHRKIAFISHSFEYASSYNRFLGYRSALEESGISSDERFVISFDNMTEENVINLTKRMLNQPEKPTAIITANHIIAVSVCQAIAECGYSIPADISVLSFDDTSVAKFFSPPLTTVWQPSEEKGRLAAETLMAAIEKRTMPTRVVTLPSMIIYRKSCGGPPENG